jgi:hypothetical protein
VNALPTELSEPKPEPASWERVIKRGSLSFSQLIAGEVPLVGWFEISTFATNLDVIIDFGEATYPLDGYVIVVPTVQGMSGTALAQLGNFHVYPGTGISASEVFVPGSCTCTQPAGLASQQFLVHAGGLAGLSWGIQLAYVGFTFGEQVQGLVVTGIAHGREVLG